MIQFITPISGECAALVRLRALRVEVMRSAVIEISNGRSPLQTDPPILPKHDIDMIASIAKPLGVLARSLKSVSL